MPKRHSGPITVGDLTPELVDALTLERDGQVVTLRGYVNGPRCPGRVKAECAAIARRYRETATDESGAPAFSFEAYLVQLRDLLLAVVPGLEDGEADVLAGDQDDALAVLRALDWWGSEDGDDTDPEATGEESTTATSSPTLPPATASGPENS